MATTTTVHGREHQPDYDADDPRFTAGRDAAETAKDGAEGSRVSAASDRYAMLRHYSDEPTTDFDAAVAGGLVYGERLFYSWSARGNELRKLGLIEWSRHDTGAVVTLLNSVTRRPNRASVITAAGRAVLATLDSAAA
ncbi:hypothetical protein [Nocardia cyriacigeorgica]|uniref:Uncharacterized protein n=1 Tax=Nocardia cyriacigeorgica (strain GUH-2) TaxID=1127134 RepID=H6R9V3_NOCCG|nr:hypothetical protein [Nocardia cyriacigeorgica]CCF61161.1 protein of unknown function [Nocardia cyriacigeorgica GUH-2]